jgi:hypothetical protein
MAEGFGYCLIGILINHNICGKVSEYLSKKQVNYKKKEDMPVLAHLLYE